jgi:hypothetical protein
LQQEFLRDLIGRLEALNAVYAITGSVASNFWGIPRLTHDVGVLVVLDLPRVSELLPAFPQPYYLSEQAAMDAVRSAGMFNIIDTRAGMKAAMWVSGGDAFSRSMLDRRRRIELLPGTEAAVGSPEDVLLHKLVWNKITPSERQLADAAGIAVIQKGRLDVEYLRSWATRQSTLQTLEAVLRGEGLKAT